MIEIISALQKKKSGGYSGGGNTIVKGSSVVNSDTKSISIDGTDIHPNSVTANNINTTELHSDNIYNSNTITTNILNATTSNVTTINVSDTVNTDKINVTGIATITEIDGGTISADSVTTSELDVSNRLTVDGTAKFNDNVDIDGNLNTTNINNSEKITTKDLEVTGTAHFWELVVDKIRSVGGSVILSPADGFTINDITFEDCMYRGEQLTGMPCLWFKATDNDRNISNGWVIDDMAISANFNEARSGVNIDVRNNYWWYLVASTNNDNNNDLTETPGQPVKHDYGAEDTDVDSHFIILNTNYKDASSIIINSSTKDKQIGNDVSMLGHYKLDTTTSDREERRSAIWLSAYSNILDTGLKAPLFAHYKGINDFKDLSNFRFTKFDARGGEIIGELRVESGQTVQDYIADQLSSIDTGVPHVEIERNNDGRVYDIILISDELNRVYDFSPINTLKIKMYDSDDLIVAPSLWLNTSTLRIFGQTFTLRAGTQTLGGITFTGVVNGDQMECTISKTSEYVELTSASSIVATIMTQNRGNASGYVSVNVVSKIEGTDAEVYKLFKDIELCQVDSTKTLTVDLRYGIYHIIGTDGVYVQPTSDMRLRVECYAANGSMISSKTRTLLPSQWQNGGKTGAGYWRYSDTMTDWFDATSANQPSYYVVKLLKNNGTEYQTIDNTIVNVNLFSGSLFTVQKDLVDSIIALDNKYDQKYSEIKQTVDEISLTVSSNESRLDVLDGENGVISGIQHDIAEIDVKADQISSTVESNYNDIIGRLNEDNSTCVVLDLKSLNEDYYYPAIVDLSTIPSVGEKNKIIYNIQVDRTLDSSANGYGTPNYGNTYNGTKRGFDLLCKWQSYRSDYGQFDGVSDKSIYVTEYVLRWTAIKQAEQDNTTKIIGNLQQNSNASTVVFYLRGGSKYNVRIDYWWNDAASNHIKVFPSGTTLSNVNYPIITNSGLITIPTSDRLHRSEIRQTAESISLNVYTQEWGETDEKLKATGIDIDTNNITLSADNTIINGNLLLNDANDGFSFREDGEEKLNISTNNIPSMSAVLPSESSESIDKTFPNTATTGWSYNGTSGTKNITIGATAGGTSSSLSYYDISLGRLRHGETMTFTPKLAASTLNSIIAGRNGTTFTPTITGMAFGGFFVNSASGVKLTSTYSDTTQVNNPGTGTSHGQTWIMKQSTTVSYTNDENYDVNVSYRFFLTLSYTVSPTESDTTFNNGSGSVYLEGNLKHDKPEHAYIGTNGLAFITKDRYLYASDEQLGFYAGGIKLRQSSTGNMTIAIGETSQTQDSGNALFNYASSETQIERQGVVIIKPANSGSYSRYTIRNADKTILAYPTSTSGRGKIEIEGINGYGNVGHVHYLKNMGNGGVQITGPCVVSNSTNIVTNYTITDHYMYLIINCGDFININKLS